MDFAKRSQAMKIAGTELPNHDKVVAVPQQIFRKRTSKTGINGQLRTLPKFLTI